eukprot:SAG22_NODE_281_length_13064_cov_13.367605_7_plen_378_part_00
MAPGVARVAGGVLVGVCLLVVEVAGHSSMTKPLPRNARDRNMSIFKDGAFVEHKIGTHSGCSCTSHEGGCPAGLPGGRPETNGQPCLWFQQGCSPGCATCTGANGHTSVPLCDTFMPPTNNATATRTEDPTNPASFHYTPWRSPGHAPTADACGLAGGTAPEHQGSGEAVFTPNGVAKQGDKGSEVLKQGPPAETWVRGTSVEVAWGIRFNHGGGYQYRLCPASEPLTEACFMRAPLEFVRTKQQLRWNNGTSLSIPGTWVDTGTNPPGSTWARNPIPRIDFGDGGGSITSGSCRGKGRGPWCLNFEPPCADSWAQVGKTDGGATPGEEQGECSGDWTSGQIVDEVVVPQSLKPGAYVVGWRWDCEGGCCMQLYMYM